MKKTVLVGLLALAGTAGAQVQGMRTWQYATLADTFSGVSRGLNWLTPDTSGIGRKASGETVKALAEAAQCRQPALTHADLLNCFGERGWEMVQISQRGDTTFFYFKRPAQ